MFYKPETSQNLSSTALQECLRHTFLLLLFSRTRSSDGSNPSPLTLQDLVEKVMVLKKSVESERYESESVHLAKQLR